MGLGVTVLRDTKINMLWNPLLQGGRIPVHSSSCLIFPEAYAPLNGAETKWNINLLTIVLRIRHYCPVHWQDREEEPATGQEEQ